MRRQKKIMPNITRTLLALAVLVITLPLASSSFYLASSEMPICYVTAVVSLDFTSIFQFTSRY